MKEMIKKYRGSLICSVLVMLIGVLVGFTSTQSMWVNVFFVVTDCALVAITFYDNRNRQQSRKIIGMTMWIIPIITLLYKTGQYGCRYGKSVYGSNLLWNWTAVYGYWKLFAKSETE